MKKILSLVIAIVMLLSGYCVLAAENTAESLPGAGKKIALITTIGGLGDGSIGDACYNGMVAAQEKMGFEFDYSEPMSVPDYEAMIIEYAESEEYDLIFLAGNDGFDPLKAVGGDFPNQKFILYDVDYRDNPQVTSEYFAKNEIGFLAGVLTALIEEQGEITIAGKTTKFDSNGKIGLVIGVEYPSSLGVLAGAAGGIHYIRPDYEYLYGQTGDWKDQARNKELALSMYDQGVNFIFQNAGGGALGIISAAQERDKFFVGYDTDQVEWDPARVIGSSMKANEATIMRIIEQFCVEGSLPWGTSEINNAANNGIIFIFNPDLEVSDEIKAIMSQVMDDLKNGKITAPSSWEEVEAFTAVLDR